MRHIRLLSTAAALLAVSVGPAAAQGKSGSAPKGGAPKLVSPTTAKPGGRPPATTTLPAAGGANAQSTHGGGKGSAPGASKKVATTASGGTGTSNTASGGTDTSNTTANGGTPATTPNAISTKISRSPEQLARIQGMLPAGMTLEQASAGFRNQGQFIAALNTSKNRGIPFAELQKAMTVDGLSLGAAVRSLESMPETPATTTGANNMSTTGATGSGTGTGTGSSNTTAGGGATSTTSGQPAS